MLPKSELDYLKWDKRLEGAIVDPETPFTAEEKLQRYEALKKAINDLPSQFLDLNVAIDRDKSTLLLFAIDQINDKDQRFEIVKLLLQKGASIETISGLYEVKQMQSMQHKRKGLSFSWLIFRSWEQRTTLFTISRRSSGHSIKLCS